MEKRFREEMLKLHKQIAELKAVLICGKNSEEDNKNDSADNQKVKLFEKHLFEMNQIDVNMKKSVAREEEKFKRFA